MVKSTFLMLVANFVHSPMWSGEAPALLDVSFAGVDATSVVQVGAPSTQALALGSVASSLGRLRFLDAPPRRGAATTPSRASASEPWPRAGVPCGLTGAGALPFHRVHGRCITFHSLAAAARPRRRTAARAP